MVRIYKKKSYNVYAANNNTYIIHNAAKDFEHGHTHIREMNTCKYLIDLCIHKTVPNMNNIRLLESILRISDDEKYKDRIRHKIDILKRKNRFKKSRRR